MEFQREHFRGPPEVFPRRLLVSLKHTHTHILKLFAPREDPGNACSNTTMATCAGWAVEL